MIRAGLALIIATCSVTACASSSASPHHSASPIATVSLAASTLDTFKTIQIAPLQALKDQQPAFNQLPQAVTGEQLRPVLEPLSRTLATFDEKLLALSWPTVVQADVDALVAANKSAIDHYQQAMSKGKQGKVIVLARLKKDFQAQTDTLNRLRTDVGLTPL